MNDYFYLGYISGTQGLKGQLKIKSKFEYKNQVFIKNFKLYIGPTKEGVIIDSHRVHKDLDIVAFNDYTDINQVTKFVTKDVYINKNDLVLAPNEYLKIELIGFVVEEDNEIIGKIIDFMYNNGNELLVVLGNKQFYIPLKGPFINKIDYQKQLIITKGAKDLII